MPDSKTESAFSVAISHCLKAIEGSKKRVSPTDGKNLWDSVPVFRAIGVILWQLKLQRQALHAAVALVQAIEDPKFKPADVPQLVRLFKEQAIRARLHQGVPELRKSVLGVEGPETERRPS